MDADATKTYELVSLTDIIRHVVPFRVTYPGSESLEFEPLRLLLQEVRVIVLGGLVFRHGPRLRIMNLILHSPPRSQLYKWQKGNVNVTGS